MVHGMEYQMKIYMVLFRGETKMKQKICENKEELNALKRILVSASLYNYEKKEKYKRGTIGYLLADEEHSLISIFREKIENISQKEVKQK